MRDCVNAEFRDRLPELLHGRLDGAERAMVLAHVASCEDCTAELALLRSLRETLAADAPAIDVSRVVASLPASPSRTTRRPSRVTRRVGSLASLALAAGIGAVAILRDPAVQDGPRQVHTLPPIALPAPERVAAGESAAAHGQPSSQRAVEAHGELALEAGLSEVSDGVLAMLLREIETMDALPAVEPEEPLPTPARDDETSGVEP